MDAILVSWLIDDGLVGRPGTGRLERLGEFEWSGVLSLSGFNPCSDKPVAEAKFEAINFDGGWWYDLDLSECHCGVQAGPLPVIPEPWLFELDLRIPDNYMAQGGPPCCCARPITFVGTPA